MLDCHPQAYRIVIGGGGAASIFVAARLFRALKHPNVAIIV